MEIALVSGHVLALYPGVEADGVPSWRRLQLAATFRDMGLSVVGVQEARSWSSCRREARSAWNRDLAAPEPRSSSGCRVAHC